jgi:hypothetical protein
MALNACALSYYVEGLRMDEAIHPLLSILVASRAEGHSAHDPEANDLNTAL